MAIYRDKNNNIHATKSALTNSNIHIDADHVLKSFFMQDDTTRQVTLAQMTKEHVEALAKYVQMRDRVTGTVAIEEEQKGF